MIFNPNRMHVKIQLNRMQGGQYDPIAKLPIFDPERSILDQNAFKFNFQSNETSFKMIQ